MSPNHRPPPAATSTTVQALRAGTFRDMSGREVSITPDLMKQLAESYSPGIHRAPVVLGHPSDEAPAFGYVAATSVNQDGLDLSLADLDPAFIEAHRAKRYPQRSLSFWPAGHPDNPLPLADRPYIRHLGFLGAMPPAIKGLRAANLAATSLGIVEVTSANDHGDISVNDHAENARIAREARDYRARMADLGVAVSLIESVDFAEQAHAQPVKPKPRTAAETARAAIEYRQRCQDLGFPCTVAQSFRAVGALEFGQQQEKSDAQIALEAVEYRARMAKLGVTVSLSEAVDYAEGR